MDYTEGQEEVKVKNCRRGKREEDYQFPLINSGRGAGLEGR